MFYMDDGIGTGDVIAVQEFPIEANAAEVLNKANQATLALLRVNLPGVLDGTAPRIKQNGDLCTCTRKRSAADGETDWSKPAAEVVNLIPLPYPMAHTFAGDGMPVLIEKAHIGTEVRLPPPRHRLHDHRSHRGSRKRDRDLSPGTVYSHHGGTRTRIRGPVAT